MNNLKTIPQTVVLKFPGSYFLRLNKINKIYSIGGGGGEGYKQAKIKANTTDKARPIQTG